MCKKKKKIIAQMHLTIAQKCLNPCIYSSAILLVILISVTKNKINKWALQHYYLFFVFHVIHRFSCTHLKLHNVHSTQNTCVDLCTHLINTNHILHSTQMHTESYEYLILASSTTQLTFCIAPYILDKL